MSIDDLEEREAADPDRDRDLRAMNHHTHRQVAVWNSLEAEGGITDRSLRNAAKLLKGFGKPRVVVLKYDPKQREQLVIAHYANGYVHTFTGFSWGYCGTGPHGLYVYFKQLDVRPEIDTHMIESWPQEDGFQTMTIHVS